MRALEKKRFFQNPKHAIQKKNNIHIFSSPLSSCKSLYTHHIVVPNKFPRDDDDDDDDDNEEQRCGGGRSKSEELDDDDNNAFATNLSGVDFTKKRDWNDDER